MVVPTKTTDPGVPPDYDPSQFPAFAVAVDIVETGQKTGNVVLAVDGGAR